MLEQTGTGASAWHKHGGMLAKSGTGEHEHRGGMMLADTLQGAGKIPGGMLEGGTLKGKTTRTRLAAVAG